MSQSVDIAMRPDQTSDNAPDAVTLPALLDGQAAEDLHRRLADRLLTGLPLVIHAQYVDRIATPCVQVLVAAARTARARGLTFSLQNPSEALVDTVVQLGLQHELAV